MLKYQGLTELPKEIESELIKVPYSELRTFLRSGTVITGTCTPYHAVQLIAKSFTQKQIDKFLTTATRMNPDQIEAWEANRVKDDAPVHEAKPRNKTPVSGAMPSTSTSHPQSVINEKVAAAQAAGGDIKYSRAIRSWEATLANKQTTPWTAEFFRTRSVEQVVALIQGKN